MAILTAEQLATLRQGIVRKMGNTPGGVTKATLNDALQALEDWYEGEKATVSGLIDAATAPYVFSAAHKKDIAAYYLLQKAAREGT